MAFPVVQSSNTATGGTSGSAAVSKPTSLAVGDLMIAWAVGSDPNGAFSGPAAPDGTWSLLRSNTSTPTATSAGFKSWWKLATSGDVSASSFTFTIGAGGTSNALVAGIIRITGHDPVSPIATSNDGLTGATTTALSAGITPSAVLQSLLIILVGAVKNSTSGPASVSGYAIANNNPSWTEIFDVAFTNGGSGFDHDVASAAWANHTANPNTATGNATATLSAAPSGTSADLQVIAILPPVTLAPTTLALTSSVSTPGFIRLILPTTLSLTSTLFVPIVSALANKWSNLAKSISTWTNTPKS